MAKDKSRVTDITLEPVEPSTQSSLAAPKPMVEQAETELTKFYQNRGESVELPALVKQAQQHRIWRYIALTLGVLLVLVLAGIYIFSQGAAKFGEESVKFQLAVPPQAPSGEVVEYVVSYSNEQVVGLNNLEFNVRYPEGFIFESSTPASGNTANTTIVVGDVAAHGTGQVKIRGRLVGNVGEQKSVTVLTTYEPQNVKAQFSKTLTASTEVVASVLHLEVESPTQAFGTQPITFKASYKNASGSKLSGIVITFVGPAGFTLVSPQLEKLPNVEATWKLPDLEPSAEAMYDFIGQFNENTEPGSQEFHVLAGLLDSSQPSSVTPKIASQEERVITLQLAKSRLTLVLSANDVSLKSAVDLGDEIRYDLAYANEGDAPLTDLVFTLKLDSRYVDWASIVNDGTVELRESTGVVRWTKEKAPQLTALQPGGRGVLTLKTRVVTGLPTGVTSLPTFAAQATVEATQLVGNTPQAVTISSNEVVSKVNTRFMLSAEGRYYTDELVKVGSGPLPPQVGQTTTYVMYWRLGNTLNEVDNVVVTTTLPQGVSWTNQSSVAAGEALIYNPNTREVAWKLNRLPAGAGASFSRPEANFEVAVTPGQDDADKVLVLIKTTTATARDTFSGAELTATAKFITTDLDGDLGAQGKGVVVR